jgi:hypothetical protein
MTFAMFMAGLREKNPKIFVAEKILITVASFEQQLQRAFDCGLLAGHETAPKPARTKKVYHLKRTPGATPKPTTGAYWALAKKLEAAGVNRHALTAKALGRVKPVKDMDEDELGRVIEVFSAVLRDRKEAA